MSLEEIFEAMFPELGSSEDVDFDTFNDAFKAVLNDGHELPEPSLEALLTAVRAVARGEATAARELSEALRESLRQPAARSALAEDVLLQIASELVRTWRARVARVRAE